MTTAQLTNNSPGQFQLQGVLNYQTVPAIKEKSIDLFATATNLAICLDGVTFSDSSGLALLADWMRFAKRKNIPLSYVNIPTQMQAMADVTGLTELLPLVNSDGVGY